MTHTKNKRAKMIIIRRKGAGRCNTKRRHTKTKRKSKKCTRRMSKRWKCTRRRSKKRKNVQRRSTMGICLHPRSHTSDHSIRSFLCYFCR